MSRIVLGMMRIESMSKEELTHLLEFALSKGITKIDIADIYGGTRCESLLGEVFKDRFDLRQSFYLQTKVGISLEGTGYDCSKDYILSHVNACIERMQCGYLDCLLLHRPDIFMDNEEIGKAFWELEMSGAVRRFGVSNFNASQIRYLSKKLRAPLVCDQVQLGLGNLTMVEQTFMTNVPSNKTSKEADDLFFYLKEHEITIQCWSPFQAGFFEGSIFDWDLYPEINTALYDLATKYQASKCAIATAFLLALTKDIEVVIGSTNPAHIQEALDGESIHLSKSDWYELYKATGHFLP